MFHLISILGAENKIQATKLIQGIVLNLTINNRRGWIMQIRHDERVKSFTYCFEAADSRIELLTMFAWHCKRARHHRACYYKPRESREDRVPVIRGTEKNNLTTASLFKRFLGRYLSYTVPDDRLHLNKKGSNDNLCEFIVLLPSPLSLSLALSLYLFLSTHLHIIINGPGRLVRDFRRGTCPQQRSTGKEIRAGDILIY